MLLFFQVVPSLWLTTCWQVVDCRTVTSCWNRLVYNKPVEFIKLVASLPQACSNLVNKLGTTSGSTSRQQVVAQQTCYKSAAGLLQVVRFYVCSGQCRLRLCAHRRRFRAFSKTFSSLLSFCCPVYTGQGKIFSTSPSSSVNCLY